MSVASDWKKEGIVEDLNPRW